MKKPFLFIGMALLLAEFIYSIPLKVSWTEGSILVKTGSEWKPLEIGTTADSSSVIQLKKDSFAEFTYAGGKLVLSAEGIYTLDKLLANANKQQQERSTVLSKVGKLVTNKIPASTTVAGVRGSDQDSASGIDWITDEDSSPSQPDPAADAYRLLQNGVYPEAAAAFARLIPNAPDSVKTEYQYSQAWCLASANDLVGAIKLLRVMPASGPFTIQRALLLARLNLETGAIPEAIQVLESVRLSPELETDDRVLVQGMLQEARALKSQ